LQLLVSVRSAEEVAAALAGGADIIDAKEPARGPLGRVDVLELTRIFERVPAGLPLSVALGDMVSPTEVTLTLSGFLPARRAGPVYLKLGFAGLRSPAGIRDVIAAGVRSAERMDCCAQVVAVAYADSGAADTVSAGLIPLLAAEAGCHGVLLDTYRKGDRRLLDCLSPTELRSWIAEARNANLVAGLAGSLTVGDLPLVCGAGPDVIGIRGAACEGGRAGSVSDVRVRAFRRALEWAVRRIPSEGQTKPLGETRETGAISFPPTTAKYRNLNG
jgi:(5-formylfuran-3-yl)methyl phosphate synthase